MFTLFKGDIMRYHLLQGKSLDRVGIFRICFSVFTPRLLPIFLIRLSAFFFQHNISIVAKGISLINLMLFGLEVGAKVEIGPGLFIPHTFGIVIGAWKIGSNVTIYQGVTLGALDLDFAFSEKKRPVIGDDVTIASGAKILGPVTVGSHSIVAANAVVTKNVPRKVVVGGVPAAILREIE